MHKLICFGGTVLEFLYFCIFVFCSICILFHLYFVAFVFCDICILAISILPFCILMCFVLFALRNICILSRIPVVDIPAVSCMPHTRQSVLNFNLQDANE